MTAMTICNDDLQRRFGRPARRTERSVRWFKSDPPTGSRCELGLSSNTKEWSATPSARSDGFDNVDGGPDCRVYIQMRGIEQVRIRGRPQGCHCPRRIALVPSPDVGKDFRLIYH